MRIAVVGGGFWGTAAAVELRADGHDVVLYDDDSPMGASHAAAGVVCESWYKSGVASTMVPSWWEGVGPGIEWLDRNAGLTRTGETFINYRTPDRRTHRKDCYIVSSCRAVLRLHPQRRAFVSRLRPSSREVVVESDDGDEAYDRVVVAAGAFTDELLSRSDLPLTGVKGLYGRSLILKGRAPETPLTYYAAPYRHYTVREWNAGLRVGDTVERGPNADLNRFLTGLMRAVSFVDPQAEVVGTVGGIRPMLETLICDPLHPRVIVATGGRREGLALAGIIANRVKTLCR